MFCKLHCSRPNAARGAVNQDLLPALNVDVSEQIQCGQCAIRDCGSFIVGHVGGFHGHQAFFRHAEILSVRAHALTSIAKNRIANFEGFHILAHNFNISGKFAAKHAVLWRVQSEGDPCQEPEEERHVEFPGRKIFEVAGDQVAVIDRYGTDFHE